MQNNEDRTPPKRVRLTGLQEQQLAELQRADEACAEMYYALGFDAAEVPVRSQSDFVVLGRQNSVRVAEADHVAVGLVAWHDESPGVAYVADITVHPDMQRFGIGSTLLEAVREEARGLQLEQLVVRCWEKASWAMSFYRRQRFMPIDATAPAPVQTWKEERVATGRPLVRPGEIVLWSPVGVAPKIATDDEMDMTLLTGELPGDD